MEQTEKEILKQTVKKSELCAQTAYDYKKMAHPNDRLLNCTITEEQETLEIVYDTEGYHPFSEIRRRTRSERLCILAEAGGLLPLRKEYTFSLTPQNLYFDDNARVYLASRDVYKEGAVREDTFAEEYKALTGYSLQKKYTYEDYLEGGADLMRKHPFLQKLEPLHETEEIRDFLKEEYRALSEDIRARKFLVNKSGYLWSRVYIGISILLIIAGAAALSYYYLLEKPRIEARLRAEADFIRGDYIQVISDLSNLPMQHLAYDQKYVLSTAYVRMESLTAEQKENILERLPVGADEKLMEYWIYIGRLNPLEAENIAMQRSDDELLLYAYMLEKDLTETNVEMTGEEKTARLSELEEKIGKLAEQYETDETDTSIQE
ncbi:MAG: hypothetical protein NC302_04910 [Bacteroidales bacterium]|nr:hypothetical protein [Bacteroidales bacterium]MCM1416362.1 hypothetical protein [bacterium]MCM1422637.1 hypothetical protein [bacterium]